MPLENGFRRQTPEDSNKTHLPRQSRWLHGNWRDWLPWPWKEHGRRHPGSSRLPVPQGQTGATCPESAEEGQPSHCCLLCHAHMGELLRASQHFVPWSWPTQSFSPGDVSRGYKGSHLDKDSCCRNKTNLQPSVLAQAGPWVPGNYGIEAEGPTLSSQNIPASWVL